MYRENYIYVLLDPRKNGEYIYEDLKFEYEPFYIGKGKRDRIYFTLLPNRSSGHKKNKLKSLKDLGLEPIVLIIKNNLTFEESINEEIDYIRKIGRRDLKIGPLTNLTNGGEGRLNGKNSPESIEKARQSRLNSNQKLRESGYDFSLSELTKLKLSVVNTGDKNPMWGKKHTDNVKENQSFRVSGTNHPMFGKKHSKETLDLIKSRRNDVVNQKIRNEESSRRNSKSILQYSLDGELMREFESIKVASEITGLSESIIGKTCRGQVKNPRKFIFKFKNEESYILTNSYEIRIGDIFDVYKLIKRNKTSVVCELENGDLVNLRKKEFPIFWKKRRLESEIEV
jgi:hypothetical protein